MHSPSLPFHKQKINSYPSLHSRLHLSKSTCTQTLEDSLGRTKLRLCLFGITWPWELDFAVHHFFMVHRTVPYEVWTHTGHLVLGNKEQGATTD